MTNRLHADHSPHLDSGGLSQDRLEVQGREVVFDSVTVCFVKYCRIQKCEIDIFKINGSSELFDFSEFPGWHFMKFQDPLGRRASVRLCGGTEREGNSDRSEK